jgi:hypothetical protein
MTQIKIGIFKMSTIAANRTMMLMSPKNPSMKSVIEAETLNYLGKCPTTLRIKICLSKIRIISIRHITRLTPHCHMERIALLMVLMDRSKQTPTESMLKGKKQIQVIYRLMIQECTILLGNHLLLNIACLLQLLCKVQRLLGKI